LAKQQVANVGGAPDGSVRRQIIFWRALRECGKKGSFVRLVGPRGLRLFVFFLVLAALASTIACGGLPLQAIAAPNTSNATSLLPAPQPKSKPTNPFTPAQPTPMFENSAPIPTPTSTSTSTSPVPHRVELSWNPSASLVDGYFVYRSVLPGGPYTRLNSFPVAVPFYLDLDVLGGQTYYYVVAATFGGVESTYSNEMRALIPAP
jgi:hypothetical protein